MSKKMYVSSARNKKSSISKGIACVSLISLIVLMGQVGMSFKYIINYNSIENKSKETSSLIKEKKDEIASLKINIVAIEKENELNTDILSLYQPVISITKGE